MALLGTLLVKLAADASGVRQGVGEAQKELKKIQAAAEDSRNVLRKAFAFDVFASQINSLAAPLAKMQGQFAQVGATAAGVGSRVMQAWGQAGLAGFIASGIIEPIRALAEEFGAVEEEARRAAEAAAEGHRNMAAMVRAETDALSDKLRILKAIQIAQATGVDEATALRGMTREDLQSRLATLVDATRVQGRVLAGDTEARAQFAADQQSDARRRFGALAPVILAGRPDDAESRPGVLAKDTLAAFRASKENNERQIALIREQLKVLDAEEAIIDGRKKLTESQKAAGPAARAPMTDAQRLFATEGTGLRDSERLKATEALRQAEYDLANEIEAYFDQIDTDALNEAAVEARRLADAEQAAVEASIASEAQLRSMAEASRLAGQEISLSAELAANGLDDLFNSVLDAEAVGRDVAEKLVGGTQGGAAAYKIGTGIRFNDPTAALGGVADMLLQSKQAQAIMRYTSGIFQTLSDGLGTLLEPIAPFFVIVQRLAASFAALIKPLTGVLEPALYALFEATTFVAGIINAVAAGLNWVLTSVADAFTETLADFFAALPFGDWSEEERTLRNMFQKPIKGLMDTMEDAFDEMQIPWEEATDEVLGFADAISQATTNLPAIFKLDRARLDAANSNPDDSGYQTGSFEYTSAGGYGGGMGSTYIFEGDVYVTADDPAEMWRQIAEVSQFRNVRTSGQRYDRTPRYAVLEGTAPA